MQVSSIAAGRFNEDDADTLFIGTSTDLLAYDVEKNRDLFYKDVCCQCQCCMHQSICIITRVEDEVDVMTS